MSDERLGSGPSPLAEVLLLWAVSFSAIVAAFLIARDLAKAVATVSFLYLPLWAMRRRGEDTRDYGVSLRAWRSDLFWFAAVGLLVLPAFALGFVALTRSGLRAWLSPVLGASGGFHLRLPPRFGAWVVDQLLVVALPEEFFYRGYLQTRLKQVWPGGARVLGVTVGPAFLLTAVLFALGHLAIFQVWRLAVFFPALLFGWLRERTGTVLGSTLLHATCNLLQAVLQHSASPEWQRR